MYITILLFSAVLTFTEIQLAPPSELVEIYSEHRVLIRGFPYQTEKGEWIISDEPALKSCCVGKGPKAKKQVFLEGEASDFAAHQVIEVEGVLGERDNHLVLKDWTVKEDKPFPWMRYVYMVGIIFLSYLLRKAFRWYRQ